MTPTVIDASPSYQPHIAGDAEALRAAGVTRAILKASEGATWPDAGTPEAAWYTGARAALRAAGVEVETYHLTHAADPVDAEVANLRRIVGADPGPRIWIDAETAEGGGANMGTHVNELRAAIARAFGVPVGRYDNRNTDGQIGPYDTGDTVWLAWPGYAGEPLAGVDPAVVLVQIGRQQIGASEYDVNVEITRPSAEPQPQPEPAPTPEPAPAPAPEPTPAPAPEPFPTVNLAGGQLVTGAGVRALQGCLNAAGYHLAIDGKGGPITAAALQAFQQRHQLAADRIAGPNTWRALVSQ